MRVMVLVPTVPKRMGSAVPWHFFQELVPLADQGVELCVVSGVQPEYELHGVRFERLGLQLMRRAWSELPPLLRDAWHRRPEFPEGVYAFSRRGLRLLRLNRALGALMDAWRPDVVHSHWAFPANSGGYLATRARGVPLVLTLRGIEHQIVPKFDYGNCLDPVYEASLRACLRQAAAVTVCCQDSVRRLSDLGVYESAKTHLIFHAVDAGRFQGTERGARLKRTELGLEGRRVFSCVARMDDNGRKGHRSLMQAFARLHSQHADVALLLVGDGPQRAELERLGRELGIADAVTYLGALHPDTIDPVMRLSTCTVLPSFSEAFGNVVFESLLVGTPVISTRVGAPADVLGAHGFGLLYEPGDVGALAAHMLDVMANESTYRRRAAAGAEYVAREMSLERRVSGFVDLYRELAPSA